MLAHPLLLAVVIFGWTVVWPCGCRAAVPVTRCDPAAHICEGRCPPMPKGSAGREYGGLCLRDPETGACVCWLNNPHPQGNLLTLFKCDVQANGSVHHVMCLTPPVCFPPGLGCLIVPHCPCAPYGDESRGGWQPVVALLLGSRTAPAATPDREFANSPDAAPPTGGESGGPVREFGAKHLLFLLAFVVGPLLCWCLLRTFFHEGKCRRKRPPPEEQPLPTEREGEMAQPSAPPPPPCPVPPTVPKFESPPPYREEPDSAEQRLLEVECGPPPTYEEAIRNQFRNSE